MEPISLSTLLAELMPGHATPLTREQAVAICTLLGGGKSALDGEDLQLEFIQECDSGMTGLIHLFKDVSSRLLLEFDTKRCPYLRRLHDAEDFAQLHKLRQEHYDRMWDG